MSEPFAVTCSGVESSSSWMVKSSSTVRMKTKNWLMSLMSVLSFNARKNCFHCWTTSFNCEDTSLNYTTFLVTDWWSRDVFLKILGYCLSPHARAILLPHSFIISQSRIDFPCLPSVSEVITSVSKIFEKQSLGAVSSFNSIVTRKRGWLNVLSV